MSKSVSNENFLGCICKRECHTSANYLEIKKTQIYYSFFQRTLASTKLFLQLAHFYFALCVCVIHPSESLLRKGRSAQSHSCQQNKTQFSSKAKESFILWSKNGETQTFTLDCILSPTDNHRRCFIVSLSAVERGRAVAGWVQLYHSCFRLQCLTQHLCTQSATAIFN